MENILINIDSRFCNKTLYPNPGKFIYKLNEQIKNVAYIKVSSIEIPNLYFTFSQAKQSNSFLITVSGTEYLIKIEDGFYNSSQLLINIQEQMNDLIPEKPTIKLNLANGLVTIECSAIFSTDFSNTSNYNSLGFHLGFREEQYTALSKLVSDSIVYFIKTESQLNVIGDNYLFLKVNDYGKIYNFDKSDATIYTYLAKIILNNGKTEQVFDNANFITKTFYFRQPVNIEKLDIELLDPYCKIIDLVKMDFSFTLEVGVIYDSNLYNPTLNELKLFEKDNPKLIQPSKSNIMLSPEPNIILQSEPNIIQLSESNITLPSKPLNPVETIIEKPKKSKSNKICKVFNYEDEPFKETITLSEVFLQPPEIKPVAEIINAPEKIRRKKKHNKTVEFHY